MKRITTLMFATGVALLMSAGESFADWKVAHWNVLHGWGRYWDNSSTETNPTVIWPPSCPYTAISDAGSGPDAHTYGIATGEPASGCGTGTFPATWNHSSAPMQALLQSADMANDGSLVAMTLAEGSDCISGSAVKGALAAGNASWSGAAVFQRSGERDAIIAKYGFVSTPSTAIWPTDSAGDVARITCTDPSKYSIIHAQIYTDAAHTASQAVHLFATRVTGTNTCEATDLDNFIRAKAPGSTARILVMGDFNFASGEAEYSAFTAKGYTDAGTATGLGADATATTCCFGNDASTRTQDPHALPKRVDLAFWDNLSAATSYWVGNKSVPGTQECAISDHALIKVGFTESGGGGGTTKDLLPSDDVFIRGGPYANTNFNSELSSGGYQYIATRAASTDEFRRKALLKFDTTPTNVPSGATILSATLYVTLGFTNTETRTLSAFDVTESGWVETDVTWNDRLPGTPWATPGASLGSARATASIGTTVGTTYAFDVTAWVQTVVNGQQPGGSHWTRLALVDTATTGTSETYKEFYAKEASVATTLKPRLVVVYQ